MSDKRSYRVIAGYEPGPGYPKDYTIEVDIDKVDSGSIDNSKIHHCPLRTWTRDECNYPGHVAWCFPWKIPDTCPLRKHAVLVKRKGAR